MIGEKICYAAGFCAEALIVWMYLEYLFIRKKDTWIMVSSFALGYSMLTFFSMFQNTTLNSAACFLVNYFLIRINYQCGKKTTLFHAAFLCFIMAIAEILIALMFEIVGLNFSSYISNLYALITLTILSKMLYLVFAVIGSRFFSHNKKIANREPHYMTLFCSLPILSAVIAVFIAYIGMASGVTSESGLMMVVTIVTLLVVNLMFLALYNFIVKSNDEYLTLQLSLQKEQADLAYYKALQDQFESQRILVHDIKKHLGVIDALAKQSSADEIEKYVSELNVSLAPSNQAKLCTDSILNLLLLHFRDECKVSGVAFQCDIRENVSAFMDASNVTTLYGNLLSNALESAIASDEKQIELSATWNAEHTVVIISVVNSCAVAPTPDGSGGFRTSKENKNRHGVGLRSIERVVKKYCGNATMYYDGSTKQFHHVIQFFTNYS